MTPQALAGLPDARARWAAQRTACTAAKEALSESAETDVPVLVGESPGRLRICRAQLERLATPLIDQTVSVLLQTIASAGLTSDQVDKILLVGGTSRLPLVSRRLSEELARPVTVDAHPKNAVALGAAVAGVAALAAQSAPPRALALVGAPAGAPDGTPTMATPPAAIPSPPTNLAPSPKRPAATRRGRSRLSCGHPSGVAAGWRWFPQRLRQ